MSLHVTLLQLYEIFLKHPEITTDSRKVRSSCLFFALKGDHFNGNQFAREALDAGAAYAITDEPTMPDSDRIIQVPDVLKTLQHLATLHRQKLGLPILAITGSNGKTTTKELTASVLKQKFKIQFTQGNLNNHIGVPLTLLSFTGDSDIGVIEMGANHAGEIATLCNIAQPEYGLITNVGKAHLEGFGSFEGVIQAKSEMYRYLETINGAIFISASNPWLSEVAGQKLKRITYGSGGQDWLRGEEIVSGPFLNVRIWFPSGVLYLNTKLVGSYNLENVLAACAIGKHFGIDPLLIKKGIEEYEPSNNRSQFMKAGTNQIIMDAYNANPTSMQASINNFLSVNSHGKLAILGDMLELGEYSHSEHQKIADLLADTPGVDVILVGKEFSSVERPRHFLHFENSDQAAGYLKQHTWENSLILIKGSRGIGLEKVIGSIY